MNAQTAALQSLAAWTAAQSNHPDLERFAADWRAHQRESSLGQWPDEGTPDWWNDQYNAFLSDTQ